MQRRDSQVKPTIVTAKKEMKAINDISIGTSTPNSKSVNQISQRASVQKTTLPQERTKFYTGVERSELLRHQVERVRQLQEENDNLQREISAKQKELIECADPLAILADVEHRKTMIARNTGEILKIYSKNDDRVKRLAELESQNTKLQKDMMSIQGKFIAINNMEERTQFASEYFLLKSAIERNIREIEDLSRN